MIDELRKLREITDTLTGNGYLKDQADEWEYALDAIPDFIYIINTKFEIRFVNKALCHKLNTTKRNLYGNLCYEVIFGCNDSELFPDWKEGVSPVSSTSLKEVYINKLHGWFDVTRSPILTKANKLIGYMCVLQDVTGQKVATEDLKNREMVLETIFNTVPVGLGLMDSRTRAVLSVNKFMLDMTGYQEYELLYKSDRVLFLSDEDHTNVGKLLYRDAMRYGMGFTETKMKTKSGDIIDVIIRVTKVKDDTTNKVVFTVADISERKVKDNRIKLDDERFESILHMYTMSSDTPEKIIDYTISEAIRLTGSTMGYVHFTKYNSIDYVGKNKSIFKLPNGNECILGREGHIDVEFAGCWADCYRMKQPIVHNDFANSQATMPSGHVPIDRHMCVPIFDGDNIVMIVGVSNKLSEYNSSDLRQIHLLSNSMWDILSKSYTKQELNVTINKFKTMFDLNKEAVTLLRLPDGEIVDVNPAFEKYSGYHKQDIIGRNVIQLGLWKSLDDRETFKNELQKNGRITNMFTSFNLKDGTSQKVYLTSSLISMNGIPHVLSILTKTKM